MTSTIVRYNFSLCPPPSASIADVSMPSSLGSLASLLMRLPRHARASDQVLESTLSTVSPPVSGAKLLCHRSTILLLLFTSIEALGK